MKKMKEKMKNLKSQQDKGDRETTRDQMKQLVQNFKASTQTEEDSADVKTKSIQDKLLNKVKDMMAQAKLKKNGDKADDESKSFTGLVDNDQEQKSEVVQGINGSVN